MKLRRPKPLRAALIVIIAVIGAFIFTFWSWSFTTSKLHTSQSIGVFPSPAEGMLTLIRAGYIGIEEARVILAEPESAPGIGPHVWYVIACVWAQSRADGSPVGAATHSFDAPGSYFLQTRDGWVLVPETALPLFVGVWMDVFGLAGDGVSQVIHDPVVDTTPLCVRQAAAPTN